MFQEMMPMTSGGGGGEARYPANGYIDSVGDSITFPTAFSDKPTQVLLVYDIPSLSLHVSCLYDANVSKTQYIQVGNGTADTRDIGGASSQIQSITKDGITLYSGQARTKLSYIAFLE